MAISLKKGEKISLEKARPGLKNVMLGLGWDPAQEESKNFIQKLFSPPKPNLDCDAAVLCLDKNNKAVQLVYFGDLRAYNSAIIHQGDNLTGDGAGDDERIEMHLNLIPNQVEKLLLVISIFDAKSRKQNFGMVENCFVRVMDMDQNKEIFRFDVSDKTTVLTSLLVGQFIRSGNDWEFEAVGQFYGASGITEIYKNYK